MSMYLSDNFSEFKNSDKITTIIVTWIDTDPRFFLKKRWSLKTVKASHIPYTFCCTSGNILEIRRKTTLSGSEKIKVFSIKIFNF